ncbi:hypothetical protein EXE10_18205 [Acinetobacter sp. WCHAc060033]|uniref:phage tail protein n=1 Tax=Acinetobacter sp. WCHAc060033 TaxID=2518624 RepID=UPI0010230DC3|nr:phage tail protein [Acinetobacter sp. WCHAc060033]RZG78353.1 hypothetical protein EXE10_18205 [Acinetobacter sp. WCHAc060033]
MISLDIRAQGIDAIVAELEPTEKQFNAVLSRTLNKMAKWVQTRTAKGLSAELQVMQKIVRRRMRKTTIKKTNTGWSLNLWYGLNDISLIHLNARETKRGVTAGKYKLDGAFIAKGQVFKRVGKGRLPLEKQVIEIKEKAETYLSGQAFSYGYQEQFFKVLEHELKWQMR